MIPQEDIPPAIVVAGIYSALFITVQILGQQRKLSTEVTRKVVHIVGGLVAITFPWIFNSHFTVALLAVLFMLLLVVIRRTDLLSSVQRIDRASIGEIVYPLGIYITLLLSTWRGGWQVYVISVLALALGDSTAALVGTRIGQRRFDVGGGPRSVEGSLILVSITLALILTGGLLWHTSPTIELLVAGICVAIVATAIEAITPYGLDNITLPLAVWGGLVLTIWS